MSLTLDTVQQQYSSGPLAIVKWAHLVNAHLFPGPAIIPALSEASKKAILAHNTSVQTDISASPTASAADDANDVDSVNGEDIDVDRNSDVVEDSDDGRNGRKQSVVSVSTTISTKTETISPTPPTLRPSTSRGSNEDGDEEEDDDEERMEQLEELGPPPFYRALLLLAQMSSKDNFLTPQYTEACVKHARSNRSFVLGFIAQQSLNSEKDDNFITMAPGVQLSAGGDAMGQQYNTPRKVIAEAGIDVIIVGRGIYGAEDRRKAAQEYRRQGWKAYEERLRAGRRKR